MEHDPLILRLDKREPDALQKPMPPPPSSRNSGLPKLLVGGLFAVIAVLGLGWYVYGGALFEALRAPADLSVAGLTPSNILKATGVKISLTEAEMLAKVSKLMELPRGEQATIAVVSDLKPLKNQQFFRRARVGDIVLMYKNSLRAILYDPEENKIVEVAPITFSGK